MDDLIVQAADLSVDEVATACHAPPANVAVAWPLLVAALREFGGGDRLVQVACAATVAVETGDFTPKREKRASAERQPDLYASQSRYWPSGYMGRGYVQLTWEENYRTYGVILGEDLLAHPDRMLEPAVAARALAAYFHERRVDVAARANDWPLVRKRVNGGLNGYEHFRAVVGRLLQEGHHA